MTYLPCREFPNEVESYFCLHCREPASAMSFLVGTHFNHPRRPLLQGLHEYPIELWSKEVAEFRAVSYQLVQSVSDEWDRCKFDTSAARERILEIHEQIRALQQEERKLSQDIEENEIRKEEIEETAMCQLEELEEISTMTMVPKMKTALAEVFRVNQKLQQQHHRQHTQKTFSDDNNDSSISGINYKSTQMTLNVLADEMSECVRNCRNELNTILGLTNEDNNDAEKNEIATRGESPSPAAINCNTNNGKKTEKTYFEDIFGSGRDGKKGNNNTMTSATSDDDDKTDPEIALLIRETLSHSPRHDRISSDNNNNDEVSSASTSSASALSSTAAFSSSSSSVPSSSPNVSSPPSSLKPGKKNRRNRSVSVEYYSNSKSKNNTNTNNKNDAIKQRSFTESQERTKVKMTLKQLKDLIASGFSSSSSSSVVNSSSSSTNNNNNNRSKSARRRQREQERQIQMKTTAASFEKDDGRRHHHDETTTDYSFVSSTTTNQHQHRQPHQQQREQEQQQETGGVNVLVSDVSALNATTGTDTSILMEAFNQARNK